LDESIKIDIMKDIEAVKGEIVMYQPDETIRLEVRVEDDTVWLNRQQIAVLFSRDVKTIGKHINNALQLSQNLRQLLQMVRRTKWNITIWI